MSTISVKRIATTKLIGYWVATAVVAGEQLAGGVTDLIHGGTRVTSGESVVLLMTHLGYPVYLLTLLGPASLCGGIALLVPGFPRLKEWAYAGIFIVYAGAVFSKVAVPGFVSGDDPGTLLWTPLILAVLTLASWALRPPSRILGVLFPARSRA
ncbi:MAG: DoxX family protein [Ktedonobacteraceae bacterium]